MSESQYRLVISERKIQCKECEGTGRSNTPTSRGNQCDICLGYGYLKKQICKDDLSLEEQEEFHLKQWLEYSNKELKNRLALYTAFALIIMFGICICYIAAHLFCSAK